MMSEDFGKRRIIRTGFLIGLIVAFSITVPACGKRKDSNRVRENQGETVAASAPAVSSSVAQQSLTEISSTYAGQIAAGLIGPVREHFSEVLASQISEESLKKSWENVVGEAEGYQGIERVEESEDGGKRLVLVTLRYKQNQGRTIEFGYNASGEIVSIFFDETTLKSSSGNKEAKEKADLEEEMTTGDYEETEVTVGSVEYPLKGVLTIPYGTEQPPVVILLPDGAECDEDGTIGKAENKPLRDIARGLAADGVASLRYEQRAKAYPDKMTGDSDPGAFLLKDAGQAVSQMFNERKVDREHIYILCMGNSTDYLAAIVKEKPKRIAGAILMGARPVAITKTYYGGEKDENISSDARYFMEENSTFPLLLLHGEKDFETTTDEFEQWKNILKGRAHTEYRSFDKCNHYFMRSTGDEDRSEYDIEGTVNGEVIRTIAEWIHL